MSDKKDTGETSGPVAPGFVLAASRSNAGKTTLSLGLQRLLTRKGYSVAPAKCGPDYIDPAFHTVASARPSINLDPWAMTQRDLRRRAAKQASNTDILFVEGVMGLYDGAAGGGGSTAHLAKALGLPIILVLDVKGQAQTAAAIAAGLCAHDPELRITGILLNRVGSNAHVALLREAFDAAGLPIVGTVRNNPDIVLPSRHLGLIQAGELYDINEKIDAIADHMEADIDWAQLAHSLCLPTVAATHQKGRKVDCCSAVMSEQVQQIQPDHYACATIDNARARNLPTTPIHRLPPLGRHIAIARDAAFSFLYQHLLDDWADAGATISYFSPLADEGPDQDADAIYLPGGYPELHLATLAEARNFRWAMEFAAKKQILIFGECGGYMVLGQDIIGPDGQTYPMLDLLPHSTSFTDPKLHLGYRILRHESGLPWAEKLVAHEFHYANIVWEGEADPLFEARNASGKALEDMGMRKGSVSGSFAHILGPENN